ncbi:MAG: leucine-rich repeat domain-containing protein [Gammaproteobacteria bacterium]|nr:leucine-rich repeat domain-containing protein [Gammaproteobacteria bacterium]
MIKRIVWVLSIFSALPAAAQPVDEFAGLEHFFPLVMDGDGFRTWLFLTNVSDTPNQCNLGLQGIDLDLSRFVVAAGISVSEARASISLSGGAATTLTSTGEQDFAQGYARLECAEPVVARMLVTSSSSGALVSMTALQPTRGASEFQLPALTGLGMLSLHIANDSLSGGFCSVTLQDGDGARLAGGSLSVPITGAVSRPLGEILPVPDEFDGGTVKLLCSREVAALGLLSSGSVFTALGAVDLNVDDNADTVHTIPLVADGHGFQSRLLVTNLAPERNQCTLELHGAGLDFGRFGESAGIQSIGSQATLTLDGSGDHRTITSTGMSSLAFGYGTLVCDGPVVVGSLLTVTAGGEPAGMAVIPSPQEADGFLFPVVSTVSEHALVFANDSAIAASCMIDLTDEEGQSLGNRSVPVPMQTSAVQFLTDLFDIPNNLSEGAVTVTCDEGIHAVWLPLSGAVFTAMPPTIFSTTEIVEPPSNDDSTAVVVTIPDTKLRAVIANALGKDPDAPVTRADMESLTQLSAESTGIVELTGLETAVNLESLSLRDNNISNISPLAGLTKLTGLNLQTNKITDISALSALTGLTYLNLGANNRSLFGEDTSGGIEDISPLSNLINLEFLGLHYNKIEDISPLSGLINLNRLNLHVN